MNCDTVTTVTVWRSPIIAMKECTSYPAAAPTCKQTLTVEPLQFHNYSGSSVITKEAFPTLSVLFTVGAVNRMSSDPSCHKIIGIENVLLLHSSSSFNNHMTAHSSASCSQQTDEKLDKAAGGKTQQV